MARIDLRPVAILEVVVVALRPTVVEGRQVVIGVVATGQVAVVVDLPSAVVAVLGQAVVTIPVGLALLVETTDTILARPVTTTTDVGPAPRVVLVAVPLTPIQVTD